MRFKVDENLPREACDLAEFNKDGLLVLQCRGELRSHPRSAMERPDRHALHAKQGFLLFLPGHELSHAERLRGGNVQGVHGRKSMRRGHDSRRIDSP
jgi:hypothetical protein